MSENSRISLVCPWTIGSIAIVAYCLANILHEGLGHGGACLLVGGRPRDLDSISFQYDEKMVSSAAQCFIAAGGCLVNLVTGGIALAVLRFRKPQADSVQYFLWLFSAVSVLMVFGYILFSGVAGVGDWAKVLGYVRGPEPFDRIALATVGSTLYFFVAPRLLLPEFGDFLNRDFPLEPQIRQLVRFPYLVGGVVFLAAGFLNPYGLELVFSSAIAASFGGTSLLAWYPIAQSKLLSSRIPSRPLEIQTSGRWIALGAAMLVIFVCILGPGVNL